MECPKCKLVNPPNAQRCDCGYDFVSKKVEVSYAISQSPHRTTESAAVEAYFFTTTTLKLTLMSVCTFGFYVLYWFYRNWVLIKSRTGQNISPEWRAAFSPLWAYSCFKHIKTSAEEKNIPESLSIGLLAVGYFIIPQAWKLSDPYSLISLLGFVPIIPVNSVALSINNNLISNFKNNEEFSRWNWVGLMLGGIMLLLLLVATFLPEI